MTRHAVSNVIVRYVFGQFFGARRNERNVGQKSHLGIMGTGFIVQSLVVVTRCGLKIGVDICAIKGN
jgi:hypothetical protein